MTTDDVRAHGVHFVGTIPLRDSEQVFRTVSGLLGGRLKRLPDGETGPRWDWIWIQVPVLAAHPDLEGTPIQLLDRDSTMFRLRPGLAPADLELGNIGYADNALDSYAVFRALKNQGVIDPGVRFQVNLPTPLAIVSVTATSGAETALEDAYERAMRHELERIYQGVPHGELAVQWDMCLELLMVEGVGRPPWFPDIWAGVLDRARRLAQLVPDEVELGLHLCYGDYAHRRSVDLDDASVLVELGNRLRESIGRRLDFLHLPVRDDVDPTTYLAPLTELRLDPSTDLYLGLITDHDGTDGALARIAAARKIVPRFGAATECGMGRRPPQVIPDLLAIHDAVTAPH